VKKDLIADILDKDFKTVVLKVLGELNEDEESIKAIMR